MQHHDFNLRFLAPHRDALRDLVKQQELDEAWVYGLIRQESRFVSDARSSAGAMGLMQLMPGTAKWVAKKMGMQKYPQNACHRGKYQSDAGDVLSQARSDLIRQPATAGFRRLQRRPEPGMAMARRKTAGRRNLCGNHSFQRNPRLRKKSHEQLHVLCQHLRSSDDDAEAAARDRGVQNQNSDEFSEDEK